MNSLIDDEGIDYVNYEVDKNGTIIYEEWEDGKLVQTAIQEIYDPPSFWARLKQRFRVR
jgi:hypothetical protein